MKSILFFQDIGSGFPLVLLHGNGESGEYFAPQIQAFSARYRVIVPDTRGHGLSPRGDGPFTLARFADDLKDLLDDLNIEKAHILGFSDGGNIALLFALKYPQYVEKLILNGANLFPSGVKFSVNVSTALAWLGAKAALCSAPRQSAKLKRSC
jgi:pimeloyl-ACP methyl ester carboxylesterase